MGHGAAEETALIEVAVLGPLRVRVGDRIMTPTSAKARTLVALLAAQAPHIVAVPTLIDELWDSAPPKSAVNILQTYVLRIRQEIDAKAPPSESGVAKKILVTHLDGYQLDPAAASVDVVVYRRLAQRGWTALRQGDLAAASRNLRAALRTWRGAALADVPAGPELALAARRLTENHAAVLDASLETDLRLGRHHELLGDLKTLSEQNPMNERLWSHYITALCQAGRPHDAMNVCRRLATTLADELGIDPSARLQRLMMAIRNTISEPPRPHQDEAWPPRVRRTTDEVAYGSEH